MNIPKKSPKNLIYKWCNGPAQEEAKARQMNFPMFSLLSLPFCFCLNINCNCWKNREDLQTPHAIHHIAHYMNVAHGLLLPTLRRRNSTVQTHCRCLLLARLQEHKTESPRHAWRPTAQTISKLPSQVRVYSFTNHNLLFHWCWFTWLLNKFCFLSWII